MNMHVDLLTWVFTLIPLVAIITVDFLVQSRHPHEPSFKESVIQSAIYIGLALGFGWLLTQLFSVDFGNQFLAAFITEKSLSVDNLFVFMIIFAKFAVPRKLQSEALLIGIAIALVLRGIFIAVGAIAIEAFSWIFYLFGAFLVYTAVMLIVDTFQKVEDEEVPGGKVVALVKRYFAVSEEFHGSKLSIVENSKRFITPLLLVMIVIGATDVLFAFDSIPAVYGLTSEPYIVFTANAFALLGLRQLYFMLSGLMQRLKYLGLGLSIILAWIGFKLLAHALHVNELPFINGGQSVEWAPEISTELSLCVILITLLVTATVSLIATRNKPAKLD